MPSHPKKCASPVAASAWEPVPVLAPVPKPKLPPAKRISWDVRAWSQPDFQVTTHRGQVLRGCADEPAPPRPPPPKKAQPPELGEEEIEAALAGTPLRLPPV